MSTISESVQTNYYYGNMKLDHPPVDYRQQRINAEIARQKAIASGVKFPRVKPSEKTVYDIVKDRAYSSLEEASKAAGVPYEIMRRRAHYYQSLMLV